MKSLEIVNILLEDVKMKNKYVFERVYNAPIATSDLETIKQDLEVLEILKKYIPKNWSGIQILCSEKENRTEDWKKIKQWLEENEE